MERGRTVGLRFDGYVTNPRLNPGLRFAPRLPKLERISFVGSRLTRGIVPFLDPIERPLTVFIEMPIAVPDEHTMLALANLKSLKKLVLRGVAIGEDEILKFQQRRPDVEIVLEPVENRTESPQAGGERVANAVDVQWKW
jgi:hypothetical protein